MGFRVEGWFPGGRCDPAVTPVDEIPDMYATAQRSTSLGERFCSPCPQITDCYNYALTNPVPKRVYGGASHRKRAAIKRYLKENPGTIAPPQPRK